MKSFHRFTLCLFALLVAAGCASTKVTEHQSKIDTEKLPRPGHIYVYPFAATPADIPPWSNAVRQYAQPSPPPTQEEIEAGRELGALVARELITELQEMGLSASRGYTNTAPRVNDIVAVGYFEAIEEGKAGKRIVLGFGAGKTELRTSVEGYQMTTAGLRQLGSTELDSAGGKTPGVLVPLAVLAGTGNPIGLIVVGGSKVVGEATDKSKVEGAAKKTAQAIADHLRVKFKEQGWIS
jgi:hypothetical protein